MCVCASGGPLKFTVWRHTVLFGNSGVFQQRCSVLTSLNLVCFGMQDMGFYDREANIRALQATGGNVNAAVDRLLQGLH